MISFKHSGDAGDVIYSLATVRALATQPAAIYLSRESGWVRVRMSPKSVANFKELLEAQSYIGKVEFYTGQAICYNLDGFRKLLTPDVMAQPSSLVDFHLRWFGLPLYWSGSPWLSVEPNPIAPVVFARSERYRNAHFPWQIIADKYRQQAVFVGSPKEHEEFTTSYGPVPHYPTKTLMEAAKIMAGSRLFIGNQSCPRAIAEGLKKDCIIETCLGCHQAANDRPGTQHVVGARVILPDL